jgi:parallel beta-helix repeat protein
MDLPGEREMKRMESTIMLALLLIGVLVLAFNIQTVRAEDKTIYIRSDGSIDPSYSPIERNGDLYTLTDNITCYTVSGIIIERNNMILDGAGYTLRWGKAEGKFGIGLENRSNVTIRNMNIDGFKSDGIRLTSCSNCSALGNNIIGNLEMGVKLTASTNCTVFRNNLTQNQAGIWLDRADSNSISGNVITSNLLGIYLWGLYGSSVNNIISKNSIGGNWMGIYCYGACSNGNRILENNITSTSVYAIALGGNDNLVSHNNFMANGETGYAWGVDNAWDNGYPSGGNYWSDYETKYPNAKEINGSGIWDTPYVIGESNRDNYPLVHPWTTFITATVSIIPNTLNLRSNLKYVTAYIELPEGYNVSDINVSSILLNNTIPVDPDAPTTIGDYDSDGIPDLMVKFNGTEVIEYILRNINMTQLIEERFMTITLTVTGKLKDGTPFQGSDTIKIVYVVRGGGRFGIFPI